ncbi:MAG: hypothetical protein OTJ43_04025 [Dehalococcoidia bacterium]|nr:hypothetical protein [Dehalococcoidia bacterium]
MGRLHFNGPDQLHGFTERFIGEHNPNHIRADEGGDYEAEPSHLMTSTTS